MTTLAPPRLERLRARWSSLGRHFSLDMHAVGTTGAHRAARRYHAVELLRFVAAIAVALYHYTFRGYSADALSSVRFDAIGRVSRYGYLGVDLFFIISGFVIANSLAGRSARSFLQGRARRLYPTFWIACSISAIGSRLMPHGANPVGVWQFLANQTLFARLFGARYVDGVYWSLDIEIRFYVLVAVVLLVGRIRQLTPLLLGWLAVSALTLVFTLPYRLVQETALQYAPLFVAGVAYSAIAAGRAQRLEWAALGLAVPLSVLSALQIGRDSAIHFHTSMQPVVIVATILAFHAVFWRIAVQQRDMRPSTLVTTLGAITYPLYLIHQRIGYTLLDASVGHLDKYAALLLVICGMLAASWIIHRVVAHVLRIVSPRATTLRRLERQ